MLVDNIINVVMMLTKDQTKILELFTSKITKRFSIRAVAQKLGKDPAQIHKAIQPLLKKKLLLITEERQVILNYKDHHQEFAYIEYLRAEEFLNKPKNKTIELFFEDVQKGMNDECFILLLFGSAVETQNPSDIDVLVIVNNVNKVNTTERFLLTTAENYSAKFHIVVISTDSVYEMAAKREESNVLNETLNKHLILYGGEAFYRLLKNARR